MAAGPAGVAHASGHDDHHGQPKATKVLPLEPSMLNNNPEGVARDHHSRSFFVGTVGTGTIYRATLRDSTLRPFITPDAAAPADSAVGMKVSHGALYVAGGGTGSIYVYKIRTRSLLARFETGTGGFLNDLVVTKKGDVYVTDSKRQTLWHVTRAMVAARGGSPEAISLVGKVPYLTGPNAFNLNGIVARRCGHELIVVNSATKSFFRIDITGQTPTTITATKIEAPALAGDGLLVDRGRLLVVTSDPAAVTALKLRRHDSRARTVRVLTDPTLRGPSTIARVKDRYLVVNADFGGTTLPYTVSAISRRAGHR